MTNLSGRGVGMDVVKKNIASLNGTVEIDSAEGFGMSVKVRLPLTLAIMDGMTVRVSDEEEGETLGPHDALWIHDAAGCCEADLVGTDPDGHPSADDALALHVAERRACVKARAPGSRERDLKGGDVDGEGDIEIKGVDVGEQQLALGGV